MPVSATPGCSVSNLLLILFIYYIGEFPPAVGRRPPHYGVVSCFPNPFPPDTIFPARMKRLRCPKCEEIWPFDESRYAPGSVLVFVCPSCSKQFKIRMPAAREAASEDSSASEAAGSAPLAYLTVVENAFHFKQVVPLYEGENVVGRWVRGTKAGAAIKTVDPSVDTTHCRFRVSVKHGEVKCTVQDGPSHTGTFVHHDILQPKEQVLLAEGDVVTIGATTLIFSYSTPE